jgi:hypothetical protein
LQASEAKTVHVFFLFRIAWYTFNGRERGNVLADHFFFRYQLQTSFQMAYRKVTLCTFAVAVWGQSSPPPAPPAPDANGAFGCWFYLPRACDRGRESWLSVGWNHDTWGTSNNAADNEYRCEQERVHDYNNYCFVDSPGVESSFAFRSGVLNPSYAISSNLYLVSNHTAIVDGYDITAISYINASMYPQAGNLIVRSNTLTVTNADIGAYIRHHGTVYVSGGTLHVTGGMRIGNDGFGELRQTGGTVTVDGDLDAAKTATSTSLIHQSGGSMTIGTLNLGSTASHAHLLVRGTVSVGDLTLRDDYSTISTGSHKTRIVVGSGGILTVTGQLSIPVNHEQIELRGGQFVVGEFWQTNVETDLNKAFITMYRDSSLIVYTSNSNNNNPCDTNGNLGTWFVQNLLDPAYSSQANKNFRPVLGEDSVSYQILTRCTANSESATGYAMEAYVAANPSPPQSPLPAPPPVSPAPPPAVLVLNGGSGSHPDVCVTDHSATHIDGIAIASQCCEGATCRRQSGGTCIFGFMGSSYVFHTLSETVAVCESYGYTVCDQSCSGQGCSYNDFYVWTNVPCPPPPPPVTPLPSPPPPVTPLPSAVLVLNGGSGSHSDVCVTDHSATHIGGIAIASQCCEGATCRRQITGGTCIFGSMGGSYVFHTLSETVAVCENYGYTVCDQSCSGQGCGYNNFYVWSNVPCTP